MKNELKNTKKNHYLDDLKKLKSLKNDKIVKPIFKKIIRDEILKNTKKNQNYFKLSIIKKAIVKSMLKINDILNNNFDDKILKYGNLKLNENIARFTLPEVVTCMANCHGCYAKKRLFSNIAIYRLSNYIIINYALNNTNFNIKINDIIKNELNEHVKKCNKKNLKPIFRFHDSGDIFSLKYFDFIINLVKNNKNVLFYTYTKNMQVFKQYELLKNSLKNELNNFNIVNSVIINHLNYFDFINNFDIEFNNFKNIIKKLELNQDKIYICSYNFDKFKKQNIKNYKKFKKYVYRHNKTIFYNKYKHLACGYCHACCNFKYVSFLKH